MSTIEAAKGGLIVGRGLGKVQRGIIEVLGHHDRGCGYNLLAAQLFHPERWEYQGVMYWHADPDPPGHEVTRAEYVSVHRAVQSLERRGLVKVEDANHMAWSDMERGGATRYVKVKLSVDTNAI